MTYEQWLSSLYGQTPTQTGGVNRSGPAVAPRIPIPANQNPNAGGYMGQAFRLAGVPVAPGSQQQPQNPVQAPIQNPAQQPVINNQGLQALMGYDANILNNPWLMQYLQGFMI